MAQPQRKIMHHWSSADFEPSIDDTVPLAPLGAAKAGAVPPRRRWPIFRLMIAAFGLVVLAALTGNIGSVAGIIAACAASLALVVRWGFWILDNVAGF